MCDQITKTKNVDGRSDSLDKTTPPSVKKTTKLLELPDYDKWNTYDRSYIVPFTLNPADFSGRSSPWVNLSTKGKRNRIIKFFSEYKDIFSDYFITYEFGEKNGRFHAHGMLYINKENKVDYWYFVEKIKNAFGKGRNKNACYKGTTMNSDTQEAFDKCYNYTTKDINVVYRSRYRIKWTDKSTILKLKKARVKVNFFTKALDD